MVMFAIYTPSHARTHTHIQYKSFASSICSSEWIKQEEEWETKSERTKKLQHPICIHISSDVIFLKVVYCLTNMFSTRARTRWFYFLPHGADFRISAYTLRSFVFHHIFRSIFFFLVLILFRHVWLRIR